MSLPKDLWYELLFEHSLDGILLSQADGRVLAGNAAACAILGYSEEEIRTLRREQVVAPGQERLTEALMERTRSGRWRGVLDFQRKDGSVVPVEVASEQFLDPSDEVLNSVFFRDVSAAQRADAARLESEIRYRTAFKTSPDAMTITDLKDGRYLDINDGFTRIFGWTRNEAVGHTAIELSMWADIGDREHFIREMNLSGEVLNLEARFRDRQGQPLTALVSSRTVTFSGQACILTVTRDVSERKRVEVELSRYRQHLEELVEARTREMEAARDVAEAASLAKGSFLANMSHEIRTPLNAMLGYLHLIERSSLSDTQREHLTRAQVAGDHLLMMLNDVLDFSKIEAGELDLESIEFEPAALLEGVRSLVAVQAGAKGLDLSVDLNGIPARLSGDATRLRQALLNLASNAVKFTVQGSIALQVHKVREDGHRVLLKFQVRDSGAGIDAVQLGKLFEAFQQLDVSTTRVHGGTGLGLAITRRLARMMGGDAGAESAIGIGSTFWFTAWCEAVAPESPDERNDSAVADLDVQQVRRKLAGRRVLLAEDNPVNQHLMCLLLQDVGLQVSVADDGRQAIEHAHTPVDLIFMDMQMPVMDGLDATRHIRRIDARKSTPIIAMTANAFDSDRRACIDAGMNAFLTKPIDPGTLYKTLMRWIDAAD